MRRYFPKFCEKVPSDLVSILTTSRLIGPSEEDSDQWRNCDGCKWFRFKYFWRCQRCPEEVNICEECKPKYSTCPGDVSHELELHFVYKGRVFQSILPSEDNIKTYVRNELRKETLARISSSSNSVSNLARRNDSTRFSRHCEQSSSSLEQDVVDIVSLLADRCFMLAKIFVKKIRHQSTEAQIRRVLETLPEGYSDTYKFIMERIQDNGRLEDAKKILSWIVYSRRPLMIDELRHAKATNLNTGYSERELLPLDTILDNMAELIYVGSDNRVRLHHYTLEDYFREEGRQWLEWNSSTYIAHICISYMSMKSLSVPFPKSVEEDLDARRIDYPFLQYAYENWGYHARIAAEEDEGASGSEDLHKAILNFFQCRAR